MIDLLTILKTANTIGNSLSNFYAYLTKRSQTTNLHKKLVFRELRDNLKRLEHRKRPNVKIGQLITSLKNDAYEKATETGFNANDLSHNSKVVVTEAILIKKRNARYLGWDCERLLDSIDSKIVEMQDLITYYDDLESASNNFALKLSNLYYQILLLVILINQSKK